MYTKLTGNESDSEIADAQKMWVKEANLCTYYGAFMVQPEKCRIRPLNCRIRDPDGV